MIAFAAKAGSTASDGDSKNNSPFATSTRTGAVGVPQTKVTGVGANPLQYAGVPANCQRVQAQNRWQVFINGGITN
jgi:hypothetical protein